jgi:glucose-6-phosphate 1-dehydrogenase
MRRDDEFIARQSHDCMHHLIAYCFGLKVCLKVANPRWRGVPFLMSAGKALDERRCEVRIKFKPGCRSGSSIFDNSGSSGSSGSSSSGSGSGSGSGKVNTNGGRASVEGNELVIRIQPDAAVYYKTVTKV